MNAAAGVNLTIPAARLDATLKLHKERQKEGKTRIGKAPIKLFTDIVFCNVCGGRYIQDNKTHYRCSTYSKRGPAACSNSISVRKDVLEPRLLHATQKDLFTSDCFEQFKKEAQRILKDKMKARTKDGAKLKAELANIERKISNMVGFIMAGTASPTVSADLQKAEAEKARISAELNIDLPQLDNIDGIMADALARYWGMALNLEKHAARDMTMARNTIKALVGGKILLVPTDGGGLHTQMQGDYAGLIELVKRNPATGGSGALGALGRSKFEMVAGARNCLNLLLVVEGLTKVSKRVLPPCLLLQT